MSLPSIHLLCIVHHTVLTWVGIHCSVNNLKLNYTQSGCNYFSSGRIIVLVSYTHVFHISIHYTNQPKLTSIRTSNTWFLSTTTSPQYRILQTLLAKLDNNGTGRTFNSTKFQSFIVPWIKCGQLCHSSEKERYELNYGGWFIEMHNAHIHNVESW